MNLSESLEFLGLEPDFDKGQLRKAYLKRLRQFKPEKDPDGFKKLRQAYELLLDHLESRGEPASDDIEAPVPAPSVVSGFDEAPSLEPYRRRIDALSGPFGEDHVAIAEQAVEAHPELQEAWILLAAVALEARDPERSVETLRRGASRGFERCLDFLGTRFPEKLSEQQWQSWVVSAEPSDVLAAAEWLIRRDRAEQAEEAIDQVLAREDAGPSALLTRGFLRLALVYQSRGAFKPSARLVEEAESRITFGEDEELAGELTYYSIFLEELSRLAVQFPEVLRYAIAESVLMGNLEPASDAVHDFAMRRVHDAPQIARMLEVAPTLEHHFHHLLSGPASEDYAAADYRVPIFGLAALLLFLMLRSCERSPGVPTLPLEHGHYSSAGGGEDSGALDFALCTTPFLLTESESCAAVRGALEALEKAHCEDAWRSLETLEELRPTWPAKDADHYDAMGSKLRIRWQESCLAEDSSSKDSSLEDSPPPENEVMTPPGASP